MLVQAVQEPGGAAEHRGEHDQPNGERDPDPDAGEVGDRRAVAVTVPTTKLQAAYIPTGKTVDQRRTS